MNKNIKVIMHFTFLSFIMFCTIDVCGIDNWINDIIKKSQNQIITYLKMLSLDINICLL